MVWLTVGIIPELNISTPLTGEWYVLPTVRLPERISIQEEIGTTRKFILLCDSNLDCVQ